MKSSNIKRLKNCSYFKGFIYKVYSPNKPKSFDDELSSMDFASKLKCSLSSNYCSPINF